MQYVNERIAKRIEEVALMLTGETARGRYPAQAVRWLLDIARQAE